MDIVAFANAKINITLDVHSKRIDGYHDIDTLMQSISLFDTLYLDITEGEISVSTNFGNIENQDNLVYKAISLFFERSGIPNGAKCHVIKRIPLLSGLGGGSADAAASLMALNKYFEYPLTMEELKDISLMLGADVPFFLYGGSVRAKGIGEDLYALPFIGDYNVLLVKEGNKTSTKTMYNKIDENLSISTTYFTDKIIENIDSKLDFNCIGNNFLDVLDDKQEELSLINKIKDFNAKGAGLSGSGPTVFGIFSDFSLALNAYNYFKENNYECYLCKTEDKSIIIE